MKYRSIFLLLTLSFFLVLCTKNNDCEQPQKRPITQKPYYVSLTDVQRYANSSINPVTKCSSENLRIEPIVDVYKDTLLYLVNYSDGWMVLSSDARTPAIVAYGETGNIDLTELNPAFITWLKNAASDMKLIKSSSDDMLSFTEEEINKNISKWSKNPPSRFHNDPIDYYVVIDTVYYSEPVEVVSHMIPSKWDQSYPYNVFCPIESGNDHYYVGCGGIAGGEMLHYLFRRNNYPQYYNGIPMDSLGVNYSSVLTDSVSVTARYLKAVNDRIDMHYYSSGSFAFPSDIEDFFEDAGYSCSYSTYDANTVKSELMNQHPVMILAFDNILDIIDLPALSSGHYFIIDGFQTRREVMMIHSYNVGTHSPVPPEDWYNYYYGAPYFAFMKMNWGWASQWTSGTNDGWFAPTSSWLTTHGEYDYGRHMYYNFNLE